MNSVKRKLWWLFLVTGSLVAAGTIATKNSNGQEPGPLGRLFRIGKSSTSKQAASTNSNGSLPLKTNGLLLPSGSPLGSSTAAGSSNASPTGSNIGLPSSAGSRLIPQPRNSQPITEADPLITTTSILRSDNGQRFGMFLQVYADGTVLDGEGVHKLPHSSMKALVDAIQASDALRQHGHCGGPPTDYIEQTHVIVYERSLGRLRANTFSFSGNIAGCDHSMKHLRDALEAVQRKLSGAPVQSASSVPTTPGLAPHNTPSASSMIPVAPEGVSIPLSPVE